MYVKTFPEKKTGRTYLVYAKSYRDPISKKNKTKTVESIGYLEDYLDTYPDPLAHFKEVAKQRTLEEKGKDYVFVLNNSKLKQTEADGTRELKYLSSAVIAHVYHLLKLQNFYNYKYTLINAKYSLNRIAQFFIIDRLLHSSEKHINRHQAWNRRGEYIERFGQLRGSTHDFNFNGMYNSLDDFNKFKEDLFVYEYEQILFKLIEVI